MRLWVYDQQRYSDESDRDSRLESISEIEHDTDSKFVFCHSISTSGGFWSTEWYYIFCRKNPKKGETRYFANRYLEPGNQRSLNLIPCPEFDSLIIKGVIAQDGEIVYSCCRHDYVQSSDCTAVVDGGRDYIKTSLGVPVAFLHLEGSKIELFDDVQFIYDLETEDAWTFRQGSSRDVFQRHVKTLLDQGMDIREIMIGILYRRPYKPSNGLPIPWEYLHPLRLSEIPEKTDFKELKTWLVDHCEHQDYLWIGNCIYLTDDSLAVQIKLRFG